MKRRSIILSLAFFVLFELIATILCPMPSSALTVDQSIDTPVDSVGDNLAIQEIVCEIKSYLSDSKSDECFGGMYLNGSNIVILLCGDFETASKHYSELLSEYQDNIEFKQSKYSYSTLQGMIDTINNILPDEMYQQKPDSMSEDLFYIIESIECYGIKQSDNKISIVTNKDLSLEQKKLLANYLSVEFDALLFTAASDDSANDSVNNVISNNIISNNNDEGIIPRLESRVMKPGDRIYIYNPVGASFVSTLSLGYRCSLQVGNSTLYGFVTAGHLNGLGYEAYSAPSHSSPYYLGYVYLRNYANNTSVDASFVYSTMSTDLFSNTTKYAGRTISTTTIEPSEGNTVYVEGTTTASVASGTVDMTSCTYYSGDTYRITDAIAVTGMNVSEGDSGGIAYMYSGGYKTVGICVSTLNGYVYVIKADNISDALGVNRF